MSNRRGASPKRGRGSRSGDDPGAHYNTSERARPVERERYRERGRDRSRSPVFLDRESAHLNASSGGELNVSRGGDYHRPLHGSPYHERGKYSYMFTLLLKFVAKPLNRYKVVSLY